MSSEAEEGCGREEPAPLNILEYTFSEKMLFVNTGQLDKFSKVFPKIKKKDIKPYALLSLKEMEGQVPRVGGIVDIVQYVAIRSLVRVLYREACLAQKHKPPPEEIYDYLISLNLSPECTRELVSLMFAPNLYANVPKVIRLHPTVSSTRWLIDLSYCQGDAFDRRSSDIDTSRKNINVILVMQFSDGRRKVISVRWHELAKLRLQISEALRAAEETQDAICAKEKTDRENLLIMKSEGHF